jgi:cyclomaltodextrinase
MNSNIQSYPDWVRDSIFYQIFPDRFCRGGNALSGTGIEPWGNRPTANNFFGGNLDGIGQKLDHLKELNINAVYLTPIFRAETNHKYDTADYYLIDPGFGSNESFKEFVENLHHHKIRLILDGVFNHSGKNFPPFVDLLKEGEKSPYRDWYRVLRFPLTIHPTTYETCGGSTYLPKLNLEHEEVRSFLLDVARFWIEKYGIDGWRLDSAVKVPRSFWKEFHATVKKASPEAYVVGELWWEPTPWLDQGLMDGGTNYVLRSLMLTFFARKEMDAEDFRFEIDSLVTRLGNAASYMVNFLSSHDTPRAFSIFQGEVDYLRLAIIFLFCMVGTPMIYYGDEVGLPGQNDPDCRRCMPWEPREWNPTIFDCYKQLSKLRASEIALRRGDYESLLAIDRLLVFRRFTADRNIIVVLNVGNEMVNIKIDTHSEHEKWLNFFTGEIVQIENQIIELDVIPSTSALIYISQ